MPSSSASTQKSASRLFEGPQPNSLLERKSLTASRYTNPLRIGRTVGDAGRPRLVRRNPW